VLVRIEILPRIKRVYPVCRLPAAYCSDFTNGCRNVCRLDLYMYMIGIFKTEVLQQSMPVPFCDALAEILIKGILV
jgi:hypothetical protein